MGNLKHLLLAGVLGGMTAFTFLTGIFLYKQPLTLKIVKVNLQHLLKEEAQKISRQGLSPEEESRALKHSLSHLIPIIKNIYQESCAHFLVVREAIKFFDVAKRFQAWQQALRIS